MNCKHQYFILFHHVLIISIINGMTHTWTPTLLFEAPPPNKPVTLHQVTCSSASSRLSSRMAAFNNSQGQATQEIQGSEWWHPFVCRELINPTVYRRGVLQSVMSCKDNLTSLQGRQTRPKTRCFWKFQIFSQGHLNDPMVYRVHLNEASTP